MLDRDSLCLSLLIFLVSAILTFACVCSIAFCGKSKDEHTNKTYRRGKTTIEVRVRPDKSGLATGKFNHPYFIKKPQIEDVLTSIFYKDKDLTKKMMKKYNKSRRVFQDDEVIKLAPLIIEAFSKSTPEQDLLVTSYSERFLREGLINYFSLFMKGDKLNIAFGKIRHRGNVSISSVGKTRNLKHKIEPTKVKKSHYWQLEAMPGQQFEPEHKNWLIIDFQSESFVSGAADRRQTDAKKFDNKFKPIVDPLEDRIKKLEEMLAKKSEDQSPVKAPDFSQDYSQTEKPYEDYENYEDDSGNMDFLFDTQEDINIIREKFYALRELLDEELITHINYEEKKYELLIDIQEYDVKAGLKELKELKSMGFITNSDFEKTKTELLKKL